MNVKIGTAGWSIPRDVAAEFPSEETSLERYSARFNAAEINSSFHRPHRLSTWQRWHDSVPEDFRFSVKLPKAITHERKLVDCGEALAEFAQQVGALGEKLAVLLVQLPPKLAFDEAIANAFLAELRAKTEARIACEPRNASWFTPEADGLLESLEVARVAADPAASPAAAQPGGWSGLAYWRLHGSPAIYRSAYGDRVEAYALELERVARAGREAWCIFDNTASSAATADALALKERLSRGMNC